MNKFIYPGFLSKETEDFFAEFIIREERDGCAVVGLFVRLSGGETIIPSKGMCFIKDDNGIQMISDEVISKAHLIYLKESKEEYDNLVSSGALVNYRDFNLKLFTEAGFDKKSPWWSFFSKKFDYYLDKAKNV